MTSSHTTWTTALAPLLWGSTFIVTTQCLPDLQPLDVSVMRALPAGLILWCMTRYLPPQGMVEETRGAELLEHCILLVHALCSSLSPSRWYRCDAPVHATLIRPASLQAHTSCQSVQTSTRGIAPWVMWCSLARARPDRANRSPGCRRLTRGGHLHGFGYRVAEEVGSSCIFGHLELLATPDRGRNAYPLGSVHQSWGSYALGHESPGARVVEPDRCSAHVCALVQGDTSSRAIYSHHVGTLESPDCDVARLGMA